MQKENLKTGVVRGFFWKALENGGDQLITFVISLVLARLLGPEKYGTMSVMLIFIAIANVIIQTGFQTALIQKEHIEENDFASVFWLGLGISALLYALLFFLAPAAAAYFEDEAITPMLRVLSLILFFGAVTSVLIARVARNLNFRVQCIATVIADLAGGGLGILAAYRGAGTWALVIQQLVKNLVLMVLLAVFLRWLPTGKFSGSSVRSLFSYGWKVLVSGLIDTIYTNLYTPVIQKLYDPGMVGLYNRANQFPQVAANAAASTMQSVLLPAFSKTQGQDADRQAVSRALMRRALKTGGYIIFPVMFGIAAVSESMIRVLLGDAWMGAVNMLRFCCLSFSCWHIHVANLQAINANGRSDLYLKLEIIKKCIGVLILVLTARFGVTAMLAARAAFDYVCTVINAWPNRKLIGYSPLQQWKDMLPEFLAAACMAAAAYGTGLGLGLIGIGTAAANTAAIVLICQIIAGILVYIIISLAFRLESFRYLLETAKQMLGKHHD